MVVRAVLVSLLLVACSADDAALRRATLRPEAPAAAPPAPAPAPVPAAPPPLGELSEDMAVPYFRQGPAGAAAQAFARGEWSSARTGFAAAARRASAADAPRLRLLIAACDAELKRWPAAAAGFAAARAAMPLLTDYLSYREAAALYFAKRPAEALARARLVAPDSIVGADAELLIGDVLRGQGDPSATAAHYRAYLSGRKRPIRRDEARFRLAEALEHGGAAERAEALGLYRELTVDAPLSRWGERAAERVTALVSALPEAERAAASRLSADQQLRRGMELFDAMRNPESEAAFGALLAEPDLTPSQRCLAAYHQAQSRFKKRDRTGAAPKFDEAAEFCKAAGDTDKEIKARYQAGRSYAFIGQHDVAVTRYQAAQTVDPRHSYSDDALLREAEEWDSMNKPDDVKRVLSALPKRFPQGDMRAEAMWRLGWAAWRAKKPKEAISWWEQQIAVMPIDDNYWAEGQAQYWIGRAQLALGATDKAAAAWEAAVAKYPAAYYAMLSLNRLREQAPERFAKLLAELSADPPDFDPAAPAFAFKPRPEWASPAFARAMELLRLGFGDPARAELRELGLAAPAGKRRVEDPDLIDKLWAMAFLFDRSGDYGTSHWPTRWHILDYRRSWPTGGNRARWKIAYPRAYWPLLTEHAARNKVPPAMQIAIVREESAFDPQLESYANAIGLTQMINSTATRFAKGTGIAPTRENLRDAEKNVTIGSRFLGFLFQRWRDFTLLVPPSYNAGETAVKRMLAVRGTWDSDEFIEGIVDDQARNYSKRVLGTFFTYTWLYDQEVPEIPLTIPAELLPKR
ncbi:MAG: transglycosylase SLT domain-containing protein [Kofleriaceae bacterium]